MTIRSRITGRALGAVEVLETRVKTDRPETANRDLLTFHRDSSRTESPTGEAEAPQSVRPYRRTFAEAGPGAPNVLYVDDDPVALELFLGQTGGEFRVSVTTTGSEALRLLEREGPYEIVVADFQMLGMNGNQFLARVQERAPETVRMLLTGHADLTAALGALNEGHVFKFLTKPTARQTVLNALREGHTQYQLAVARRELMEQTVRSSVKALTDLLALASPTAFGRSLQARAIVDVLLDHFGIEDRWEIEVAAMVSQIGSISLPAETALRLYQGGEALSDEEKAMVERIPELGAEIIGGIPQLEGVARIVRYQDKHFGGAGKPADKVKGHHLPWGARALKLALDYVSLEAQGMDSLAVMDTLRCRALVYDPALLKALAQEHTPGEAGADIRELKVREVVPGMTFAQDVRTQSGQMLIARGTQVTAALFERIRNLGEGLVQEPVCVAVRRAGL